MSPAQLLHIPEIAKQPANRKTYALHLIGRGADAALLLFWINLITGAYSHLHIAMVRDEAIRYADMYPEFVEEIGQWHKTFERQLEQPKTFLCKVYHTPSIRQFVQSVK